MLEITIYIVLCSFLWASVVLWFLEIISPGNLGEFYYNALIKWAKVEADRNGVIISARWFFRPLGGCPMCFLFWFGVIPWAFFIMPEISDYFGTIISFFAFSGASFVFLNNLEK